jgi:DNA polymerase (family 10)
MILPIQNADVADSFEEVADLLEIEHENRFRVRAYRGASRTMGGHPRGVEPWEEG